MNIYEDELNLKETINYKDLYAMQPAEVHAYGLQEYVEQQLTEKTGIDKVRYADLGTEIKNIHNKALSMAKLAQYRSKQN